MRESVVETVSVGTMDRVNESPREALALPSALALTVAVVSSENVWVSVGTRLRVGDRASDVDRVNDELLVSINVAVPDLESVLVADTSSDRDIVNRLRLKESERVVV